MYEFKAFHHLTMPLKITTILLLAMLTACSLDETEVHLSANDVAYIYDGDTITFQCIANFPCDNNKTKVRVKGVDTPEIKGQCQQEQAWAREAKQHTVALLRSAEKITLVVNNTNTHDKYQRLLAYVYVDGLGLHDSLIRNGLGRSYLGSKRKSWC